MKTLHITGYFQTGYEEYYTVLNQAKIGHEVHVLTSNWIAPLPGFKKKEKRNLARKF